MSRVIVVGGGVAGLAVTVALARDGHVVTVLEADATPLPPNAIEAFHSWDRRGAPQVWHSHAFLARLRSLLVERAPEVLAALHAAGAEDLDFFENLPPEIDDRSPKPGDEELVMLGCRRITFEWALRRLVLENPRVSWRAGLRVTGLTAERSDGPPRVTGVRFVADGSEEIANADLVVDAGGRGSRLPRWLAEIGAGDVEEDSTDCGIFYTSRFYRLREGATPPVPNTLIGMDLGYLKYAIFPGDAGIFSVTLAASVEDEPLRVLYDEAPFEAAIAQLPPVREWIETERSEPITDVRTMAGLRNRRRCFVGDGVPLALGVHAVGDAAVCSNPLYGRGCTLAVIHAFLLADALREHPNDPAACALAFDAATRREIDPWYHAAVQQDRDALEVMAAAREEPARTDEAPNQGLKPVDPRAFMRSVIQEGLFPAMRTDAVVLRAVLRFLNLLDTRDEFMANGDVMRRVIAAWSDRERRLPMAAMGPPRPAMLEVLAQAA